MRHGKSTYKVFRHQMKAISMVSLLSFQMLYDVLKFYKMERIFSVGEQGEPL